MNKKNKKTLGKLLLAFMTIGLIVTFIDFMWVDKPILKVRVKHGLYESVGSYIIWCDVLKIYDEKALKEESQKVSPDMTRVNLWPYGETTHQGKVYYYYGWKSRHDLGFTSSKWDGFGRRWIYNSLFVILFSILSVWLYLFFKEIRDERRSRP